MTKLEIANMALGFRELEPISSLTKNDVGKNIARLYEPAAAWVLSHHEWQEAVTWATVEDEATDSYTSHATNNDKDDLTFIADADISAHTPQSGTIKITIADVEYDHDYTSWTTRTFTLTTGLEGDCDGDDTATVVPNNWDDVWEYMYDLPSDCLHVLQIRDSEDYEYLVEGDYLYTNEYDSSYGFPIRYIKDVRDEVSSVVVYSDLCGELIAMRIAYLMASLKEKATLRSILADAMEDAVEEDVEESVNANKQGNAFWTETS